MPTEREWRTLHALRADRDLLDEAADWLWSNDADRRQTAALYTDRVAHACGRLLDLVSDELDTVPPGVRWQAVQTARQITGATMEQPGVRRARRR